MIDEDDALAWERLDYEVAYSCPGFEIVHETVRMPDGTETDFDYLSEPESVVILPFTTTGDVVVIEEWREAVKRVNYGLPAGSIEPDDANFATAARRELEEETGYVAGAVDLLVSVEPANGIADTHHHYFVATDCEPAGEQQLDFNESIRVGTTQYDDLLERALAGGVPDGRTLLGLLYYDAHRR